MQPPPPAILARMRLLRWTSFALVAAAYVLSFFHRIAPAAIAGELRQTFGASGTALGALAATYFYVYTLMQVPTGMLVDALGPRRVVTLGGVCAGLGSIVFGSAPTLAVAAAGRALVGLGVSVAFICLLKLVAAWFREREFATLTGLVMFLGNMGAVLSAAPLAWLVTVTSWRNVFVGVGLASITGAAITWFVVRDDPRQAGLPSMRELEPLPLVLSPVSPASPATRWYAGLLVVARNRATWPGFFVNLGVGGTFFAFAGLWAVPYLTTFHRMSRERATWHTTALLLAFALGSLLTGKLSDRLGRRRPLMLGLALVYALSWGPWVLGGTMPLAASLGAFVVMGASAAAFTLTWANVKEVNPPALSGTAMAVVNTGVFLGPALYQPLVGLVLDRGASYSAAMALLAAFALLGPIAASFLREPAREPRPTGDAAPPRRAPASLRG